MYQNSLKNFGKGLSREHLYETISNQGVTTRDGPILSVSVSVSVVSAILWSIGIGIGTVKNLAPVSVSVSAQNVGIWPIVSVVSVSVLVVSAILGSIGIGIGICLKVGIGIGIGIGQNLGIGPSLVTTEDG